jgi:hypothetical protein
LIIHFTRRYHRHFLRTSPPKIIISKRYLGVTLGGRMSDENRYRAPRAPLRAPGPGERSVGGGMKRYELDCTCGRTIVVVASQAGTKLTCECGQEIAVPSLSKLRVSAGANPYEVSVSDTIRRMILEGELPAGPGCEVSGEPTDDILELYVLVTREFVKKKGKGWYLVLGLLISPLFYFAFFRQGGYGKLVPAAGSETAIPTPVRLASRYHSRYRKASQWRLRRLLRRVPIYDALLKDHPEGRIVDIHGVPREAGGLGE